MREDPMELTGLRQGFHHLTLFKSSWPSFILHRTFFENNMIFGGIVTAPASFEDFHNITSSLIGLFFVVDSIQLFHDYE